MPVIKDKEELFDYIKSVDWSQFDTAYGHADMVNYFYVNRFLPSSGRIAEPVHPLPLRIVPLAMSASGCHRTASDSLLIPLRVLSASFHLPVCFDLFNVSFFCGYIITHLFSFVNTFLTIL